MSSHLTSDQIAEITSPADLQTILGWIDDINLIIAARPQGPVVALVAQRRRCSVRKVYGKLKSLKEDGPTALLDGRKKRKASHDFAGHRSPAFIAWVHSLYYQVTRQNATPSVQRLMLDQLRAWRLDPINPDLKIPGYDHPPVDSAQSRYRHPYGWSLRNLNEIKPDHYQRTEAGIGRLASSQLLPPVLTTRVGLKIGEAYMFDDQYYDLMVHYGAKVVRPVGLNVLDLASGCDIARGIRPELPDNPDGEKSLVRRDTIWLVVHVLTFEGFHKDRCKLILESGTSTVAEPFKRTLALVSDGRITVDIGEVSKEIVRGVLLPSKGNPRFKASRESWFNLLRNRMGHLPLSVGQDRDHKPEDTDRLALEDRHLLAIAEPLPPSVLSDLQFEGLPWSRFHALANYISEAVNQRTEHDLEGWVKEGRERVVYRLGSEWISEPEYLDLAPDTRALIIDRMRRGEVVSRVERLSPRAVYESGRENMERISPFRWHLLIPAVLAIPRTIPANRQLVIDRREYGPEPLHFLPYLRTESGEEKPLPAGEDVLVFLSPISPTFALLTKVDQTVLGIVFAVEKGTRFEQDKLIDQWSVRQRLRTDIGGSANHHNKQLATERQERRENNAKVAREAGIDEEKVRKIEKPSRPKKPTRKPREKPFQDPADSPSGLGIFKHP